MKYIIYVIFILLAGCYSNKNENYSVSLPSTHWANKNYEAKDDATYQKNIDYAKAKEELKAIEENQKLLAKEEEKILAKKREDYKRRKKKDYDYQIIENSWNEEVEIIPQNNPVITSRPGDNELFDFDTYNNIQSKENQEALDNKLFDFDIDNNLQSKENQEALEIERRKSSEEKRRREQIETELAALKAQKKKEKELITADTEIPQITISSSVVQDKRGIIEGIVSDNVKLAELTINGEIVMFDEDGNFTFSTFIPQNGKELVVQATDSKGLSSKKVVALQRKETATDMTINFTELNPLKLKGKKNENALALIIGVNNYIYAPEAKYADRDASYFADFANNILGVSEENIKTLKDTKASETEIKIALKRWLKGYSTPEESDIYIFFAGHGLASTDGKELYLLPYDGEPRLLEDTALLRSEIFDTIKSIKPKSVTVFLDTCYSGQTRDKNMILAEARPISIVPVESDVPENFTVFSASSGSEISGSLPEADHGLFSYFLMKGLEGDADANNDKKITNGELHSYVRSSVTRQAVRLGREQTPQLQGEENRVLVEFN